MRFLSLFSGIEAASCAWLPLGWECAGVAEIEPFPCAVLKHHYPTVPNLGDITQVTQDQIESLGHIDIVVGGFPCFVAGTLVLSEKGFVPIESLLVGDLVLTHTGSWKPITSVMKKNDAPLRVLRGTGVIETKTTDEHPYFTRVRRTKWNNEMRRNERKFDSPTWTNAGEIGVKTGHFAGQVLPDEIMDDRAIAWWWLVGRYLADGWRVDRKGRKNGRVVICCGHKEEAELEQRIKDAGFVASKVKERTSFKFHITRGDFYELLAPFGRLAGGKTIPGFVFSLDQERAKAIFLGWATGDGWRNEKHKQWSGTTVSKSLALGLALLAQRAFGRVAAVYSATVPDTVVIEGRVCNQKTQYTVRVNDRNKSSFVDGRYGWKLLRHSKSEGIGEVFNISVADDESYVANGAIVHNCQDLSVAGKRKGLKNDDGTNTRSGLFFDAMRIVRWSGARFVLFENVPGIYSSNAGRDFAAVVGEILGIEFDVPRDGWQNAGFAASDRGLLEWATLDAQYFGVAQRRRRMFALADFGDWTSRSPILLERESLRGDTAPSRDAGQSFTHDVAPCLTSIGRGVERTGDTKGQDAVIAVQTMCMAIGQGNAEIGREVAPTLNCNHEAPIAFRTAGDGAVYEEGSKTAPLTTGTDPCANVIAYGIPGNWIGLKPENGGNAVEPMHDVAPRLTKTDLHGVGIGFQVRRLTPIECEFLQGFSRNYTQVPYRGRPAADGPRYKALGNSMAVPCMAWIGRKIMEAM